MFNLRLLLPLTLFSTLSWGQNSLSQCVMKHYSSGNENLTIGDIRRKCESIKMNATVDENELDIARASTKKFEPGVISNRLITEIQTQFDPYVITPHKMNYILPALTTNRINKGAYTEFDGYEENLEELETKFQLSFKVPLNENSLLIEGDRIYLGFTLQAWWQVYSENISKPFRESNYQPELFYIAPLNWHPFGGNTGFVVGFEHQSNGRAQILSRSWNRVYGHFLFEKEAFALSLRPWWRVSEEEKEFPFDSDGDDNPNIEDYMGYYELGMAYKWDDLQLGFMGRYNFSSHNGAAELGLTFPLWGKLRGYASVFTGYGESLIDYNHKQTRFGLGIALNDLL